MSHTPGPWRVDPSYENIPGGGELRAIGATYRWPEGEGAFVALAFTPRLGVGPYAANREDDARLMAASPDLLSALKRVLAGFESNAFQRNTDGDGDPAWAIKFMPHLLALADATKAIDKAEGR